MTGYPWSRGQTLRAEDLNAAFGGSGGAGGSYLSLSGGTVSGSVTIGADKPNHITIAGGPTAGPTAAITTTGPSPDLTIQPDLQGMLHFNLWRNYPITSTLFQDLCRFDYSMTGTTSGGVNRSAEVHSINADTVAGDGIGYFNYLCGPQTGAGGGRTGLGVNMQQGGPTSMGIGNFYVGAACFVTGSYNAGGNSSQRIGSLFAVNDLVNLQSGGTYWEEVCGYELDVGVESGADCAYKHGMKVNLWTTNAVAGLGNVDTAYCTSSNANNVAAGWDFAFAVGDNYGFWPMKTTGTLIGTVPGTAGGPAYNAAWGIDFSAVAFSGGLIRGSGFSVNGAGNAVTTAVVLNTAAGPTIRSGTGAATGTQPKGSMWLRTDGAVGSTLYITQGGGTWNAVAGV